ncbi:MAG: peroxiredoxin [Proteobacteria bacterium]|nr:peroxiredoxin [Pseudomonadota bacterium]
MVAKGMPAPDFTLPDSAGRLRSLAELLAAGPLLLYFYPADFTPGCTREACSFRDRYGDLQGVGLGLAGVSPQAPGSHERFRARHGLPFVLLADEDKRVIRRYGVDGPLGWGVRRASFLIDQAGLVIDSVRADLRIERHVAFVQAAVDWAGSTPSPAGAGRRDPGHR